MMTKTLPFLLLFFFGELIAQTPSTNANDNIPTYTTTFRLAINPGYNGSNWTDEELAELAAGAPSNGIDGVGIKALRVPLPEDFLETWGYDIRESTFDYYTTLGLLDNTVFLEGPKPSHQDMTQYCSGTPSVVFDNLYEPIWDNGNGTPINENNYFANYVYKTVNIYKDEVKFWEVWNEPDFDYSGNGWKPPGMPGNWWENVPDPCDYKLQAPVYYYIRKLRITYEVVKSIDPDAFVTTGGIGFESFLDIIMRFTDNPVDGSVDPVNYPYAGGAYFDALSYHSYPDQNGSLRYWDNGCQCWIDNRNSDAAAIGIVDHKNRFETVLFNYGYDDITYPKKEVIITETHIPNVQLYNSIGSYEAQRNFDIKTIVYAYANGIRHMALFKLADTEPAATAWSWLQVSGLYQPINVDPFTVTHNESGIATRTTMDLLFEVTTYDAAQTAALNLPSNINGAAFNTGTGYIYVLWAKTETDQSEVASATYSFPSGVLGTGTTDLDKREWDFSNTGTTTTISINNIALTGAPVFLEEVLSVGSPPSITVSSTDASCFGANNGTASASTNGGTPGYIYNWSNGSSGANISNLVVGTYTVTVTDNAGQTASASTVVNQPSLLNIAISNETNVDCFGNNNGSAIATGTGGTGNFSFIWSNGNNSSSINNLSAGTYTVTTTDGNNCTSSASVIITEPTELMISAIASNVSCFGMSDGNVNVSGIGGTPPYMISYPNGSGINLAAGNYNITITDSNSCSEMTTFNITEPAELFANATSTNETMANSNDGTASASPSGGIANYSYNWSNGLTIPVLTGLVPGTYTVTVTDANNCESIEMVEVLAFGCSLTASSTAVNSTCSNVADGTAMVTAMGGNQYTYNWSSGGTSATENNLLPGTYTVTINDGNNCQWIESVTIGVTDNIPPTIICPTNIIVDPCTGFVTYDNPIINDNCSVDPIVDYQIIGTASGSIAPVGTSEVILIATDASGNQNQCSFSIDVNHTLDLTTTSTDSPCAGDNLGMATADANGTNPGFNYLWSNGEMAADIDNLAPGTYTVTVTDLANCTTTAELVILEPLALEIIVDNIINESNFGAGDGAIEVTINGGMPPFNYEWILNGNVISTDEDPTTLVGNDYTLNISDANGCLLTSPIITIETTVSSEDLILEKNIRLFPNPSSNEIYLDFTLPRNFDFEISIHDAIGKLIFEKEVENISHQKLEFNISDFASGLFFIRIKTENGIWIKKFIVQ